MEFFWCYYYNWKNSWVALNTLHWLTNSNPCQPSYVHQQLSFRSTALNNNPFFFPFPFCLGICSFWDYRETPLSRRCQKNKKSIIGQVPKSRNSFLWFKTHAPSEDDSSPHCQGLGFGLSWKHENKWNHWTIAKKRIWAHKHEKNEQCEVRNYLNVTTWANYYDWSIKNSYLHVPTFVEGTACTLGIFIGPNWRTLKLSLDL
jgi:hypothetical protein